MTTAAPIAAETLEGLEPVARVADVLSAEKGLKAVKLSNGTPVVLVSRGGAIQSALYGLCPHKQAGTSSRPTDHSGCRAPSAFP